MTASVLRFDDVHFEYEKRKQPPVAVLSALSFRIERRERVALIGRSGSGKSTVLGLSSGRLLARTGVVEVCGRDLAESSTDERARLRLEHIAHVHQDFRLLPHYSAVENIELPLLLQGAKRSEARDRAHDALTKVALAGRAAHRPQQLSGGEQQRVAIARAVVRTPTLLLADEPTGSLDAGLRDDILALMFELCPDAAIVLVTHDPVVADAADRAVMLGSVPSHTAR